MGIVSSGGGLRAAISLSSVVKTLEELKVLDCVTYMSTCSGATWLVRPTQFELFLAIRTTNNAIP